MNGGEEKKKKKKKEKEEKNRIDYRVQDAAICSSFEHGALSRLGRRLLSAERVTEADT